jgi:hypothetical protein
MLRKYRLTIWYIAQGDGELHFLAPIEVDAVDAAEASRTGSAVARLLITAGFAAKVMVRIEGQGVDRTVELEV